MKARMRFVGYRLFPGFPAALSPSMAAGSECSFDSLTRASIPSLIQLTIGGAVEMIEILNPFERICETEDCDERHKSGPDVFACLWTSESSRPTFPFNDKTAFDHRFCKQDTCTEDCLRRRFYCTLLLIQEQKTDVLLHGCRVR